MTRYRLPDGRIVGRGDLPSILDDPKNDELRETFEEEFNEVNFASDVLYEIGGHDLYHSYYRDWLSYKAESNSFLRAYGITPISGSRRPAPKGGACKAKAPARSSKPKSKGARR